MAKRKAPVDSTAFVQEDAECIVTMDNGKQLCCPAYPAECTYISVLSEEGLELLRVDWQEFEDDAKETLRSLVECLLQEDE